MFTGIVEGLAQVEKVEREGTNMSIWFSGPFTSELKIDQSVAHNGVCLTIDRLNESEYRVTAIKETIDKTNFGQLEMGAKVNVERCMKADGRFDGHVVQGHVDGTATVKSIEMEDGSWFYTFDLTKPHEGLMVEKGSACLNGTSLTLVNVLDKSFSVAIIPYTYEFTNFHQLKVGDTINVEFDILGKYVVAATQRMQQ
jgi:riboflavin synthase